jgi:hypothetical protein
MNDSQKFLQTWAITISSRVLFRSEDSKNRANSYHYKEPKNLPDYPEGTTEEESILYGEVVLPLASFLSYAN